MPDRNFIDDLAKRLNEAMPKGLRDFPRDMEKNFHAILQSAFAKLDLITRKEFDAQTNVLKKTRQKVETLEKFVYEREEKTRRGARVKIPKKAKARAKN
jgi:BMFP domain-containing protein YqiC